MTYESVDEVIKVIEAARRLGASEIEVDGLKVKFNITVSAVKTDHSSSEEVKAEDLVKPLSVLDQMSPEEILMYASPYYDELQAQKEAHVKKLAEESVS